MQTTHSFEDLEKTFGEEVSYLNKELKREGYDLQLNFDEVLSQAKKEFDWFYESSHQDYNEYELLGFYRIAFFYSLQALCPAFLVDESLKSRWVWTRDEKLECTPSLEQQFDAVSPASQARKQLNKECEGMILALEVIRARAEELESQSESHNDSYVNDRDTFMEAYTEILADVKFYHARQSAAIKETGKLDRAVSQFTQTKCLATITEVSAEVSKTSSFSDVMKSLAVTVMGWFGWANAVDKTVSESYAFYQPQHSAAKLAHAKNIVKTTLSANPA